MWTNGEFDREIDARRNNTALRTVASRSLAGKPLAGFCATQSRRIQVLYGIIVHVIRCNTHYFIDNRR